MMRFQWKKWKAKILEWFGRAGDGRIEWARTFREDVLAAG